MLFLILAIAGQVLANGKELAIKAGFIKKHRDICPDNRPIGVMEESFQRTMNVKPVCSFSAVNFR